MNKFEQDPIRMTIMVVTLTNGSRCTDIGYMNCSSFEVFKQTYCITDAIIEVLKKDKTFYRQYVSASNRLTDQFFLLTTVAITFGAHMNLISRLGGYDEAKKEGDEWGFDEYLNSELLNYRRDHNMFENGDNIVWISPQEPGHVYKVDDITSRGYSYGNDWGWCGVISTEGVGCSFKHATDLEIELGYRS